GSPEAPQNRDQRQTWGRREKQKAWVERAWQRSPINQGDGIQSPRHSQHCNAAAVRDKSASGRQAVLFLWPIHVVEVMAACDRGSGAGWVTVTSRRGRRRATP